MQLFIYGSYKTTCVFFQHDFPMCYDMTDRDHWLLNQTDFSSNPTCIILNMFLNLPELHFVIQSKLVKNGISNICVTALF